MAEQLFYESITVGADLPSLVKHPTTQQLVKWAGAAGDVYQAHYDKDFAQSAGLPGVIVHGWLTFSFMGQLVTDWMGEQGTLKKMTCSYRGLNFPGQDITCRGKVTKKYVQDGEHLVELQISAENQKGEVNTPGTALVALPSRK